MSQFFFDVFDGTRAVRDDFGDAFADVDEAADQAAGLLVDLARDAAPAGLEQDFGVIVRDDGNRDVYQAVLSFRAAFLDGATPVASSGRDLALPPPDTLDLIRQSRETRAASRELSRRDRLRMTEWSEMLSRTLEMIQAAQAAAGMA